MNLDLKPCTVDPTRENWASKDDAEVYHAARAGIPEANAELDRRDHPGA